ncbi:MAG: hypothetical protein QOG15_1453 [Solirubrobacteraceae bacterium]|jgi:hypothetical protein|nr:hypothetical protein [Solirubrobacteraceae bacterium]
MKLTGHMPAVAGLACAGLAVAGCGTDSGSLGPGPTRPAAAPATAVVTTTPDTAVPVTRVPGKPAVLYEAWFIRDGKLYSAQRDGAGGVRAVANRALRSLEAGPWPEEVKAGVSTALEPAAGLRIVSIAGGLATVHTAPGFFAGDRLRLRQREAQVVYTVTQYPTIRRVRFAARDRQAPGRAFTRKSFENVLPAIVVDAPRGGATAHSPVTISGTANVFEATVSMRILDASGTQIARTFTTATCGSGCRGDFSASLRYSVDRTQKGMIQVFEVSAKDGRPTNVVAVPVTLSSG